MKHLIVFGSALLVAASSWAISPQSGTWVVSDEVNGEPGRGIALDVQGNTLVMQVYAYKPDGSSAFYLSAGSLSQDNRYDAALNEYRDGPYFGSTPRNGREVGTVGNVKLRFINGTTGFIQFPNEPERAFERFQFKYGENPQSLLGYWVMTATTPNTLATVGGALFLTTTSAATSTGTGVAIGNGGTTACEFQKNEDSFVVCVDATGGRVVRAYGFKLSVNEGFGVTYTTTATGAQLGPAQILTAKRLLTSDNQLIGLLDDSSEISKSAAIAGNDLPAEISHIDLSAALQFVAEEFSINGLLNN